MKLTFFEKELFDNDAFEKPTISINSQDATQRELVKKIATPLSDGAFVSGEKNKAIRTIKIPAEYLDFFKDGTKFIGTFKHTKLTSGEPEIVSRTTAPQVTKPIDVSFNVNANFELETIRQEVPGVPRQSSGVSVSSINYEPFLIFRIGGSVVKNFFNGFGEINSFISQYTRLGVRSTISVYTALRNLVRGSYRSGFYNRRICSTGFTSNIPDNLLPPEIVKKEVTTTLAPQLFTITREQQYDGFLQPLEEVQYWRVTGNIKNTFSVKDYSLQGSSTANLILPVQQRIEYSGGSAEWSNPNGTPRNDNNSVTLDNLLPKNLTSGSINVSIISNIASNSISFNDMHGDRVVDRGFVYSAVTILTFNNSSFFDLLRPGFSVFDGFNEMVGTFGGIRGSRSFQTAVEDRTRTRRSYTVNFVTPTYTLGKNQLAITSFGYENSHTWTASDVDQRKTTLDSSALFNARLRRDNIITRINQGGLRFTGPHRSIDNIASVETLLKC